MSEFDRMCIDSSNDLNEAGSPSSHPEATKARKRRHNMDPIEKRVYNAREADRKAVEYAVKKRKTSHGYLQASAETQSQLLDQTKAEIMNKRLVFVSRNTLHILTCSRIGNFIRRTGTHWQSN